MHNYCIYIKYINVRRDEYFCVLCVNSCHALLLGIIFQYIKDSIHIVIMHFRINLDYILPIIIVTQ